MVQFIKRKIFFSFLGLFILTILSISCNENRIAANSNFEVELKDSIVVDLLKSYISKKESIDSFFFEKHILTLTIEKQFFQTFVDISWMPIFNVYSGGFIPVSYTYICNILLLIYDGTNDFFENSNIIEDLKIREPKYFDVETLGAFASPDVVRLTKCYFSDKYKIESFVNTDFIPRYISRENCFCSAQYANDSIECDSLESYMFPLPH